MQTVQVSRWSQAAANLLPPQQDVMGWAHSCYARIINVRIPGGCLLTFLHVTGALPRRAGSPGHVQFCESLRLGTSYR